MMAQPPVPASKAEPDQGATAIGWPAIALGLVLLMQFSLIFTRAVNWDEFFFYHEVADFAEGHLARPLQTIHVRLFAWLPEIYPNSVDAIQTARLATFAFELATLAAIIRIGRHFADLRIGILCALLYVSAGFVLQHGTSFRVDPMLAAALMGALVILTTTALRWPQIIAFGLLAGFAAMVSIKAVLYISAFAGIAWMRWNEAGLSRSRLITLAACAVAALLSFAAIYWWHAQAMPQQNEALSQGSQIVGSSGSWVFFLGIPPYWQMALKAGFTAPFLLGCIVAAPFVIVRSDLTRSYKIAALGLWLPITTIAFYTNTAAYYYGFILAPVVLGCILPLRWAVDRYGARLISMLLLLLAGGVFMTEDRSTIDRQRQLVANVQEIFPQPVRYFDQNYMMGAWPKGNGFMTPWGMSAYYANGVPAYRAAMEAEEIPLIIANSEDLQNMLDDGQTGLFVPEDDAAIRQNYILHSWPIWVAGKKFAAGTDAPREEFLIPGKYTVQGGKLVIDGREYGAGSTAAIERGMHSITVPADSASGSEAVSMIWGDHLQRPSQLLEPGPLYVDF